MTKISRHILLFFYLLLLPPSALAADVLAGLDLHGLAIMRIHSRHIKPIALEEAVTILEHDARFVGLTDFGTVSSQIVFSENHMVLMKADGVTPDSRGLRLHSILNLPLSEDEFLAIIAYRRPDGFTVTAASSNRETWKKNKNKKLTVTFFDFAKTASVARFPRRIAIKYGKNDFELKWQNVTLHSIP